MRVELFADGKGTEERAQELSSTLSLPVWQGSAAEDLLLLAVTPRGLELREAAGPEAAAVAAEFRRGRGSPLLLRAALAGGGRTPLVIDATAGLGQDGFALAEAGSRVIMIERSQVVAALLQDGLRRALDDPGCLDAARRVTVLQGEARELLPGLSADVVYLDPMYPRSGREARKSKGMRLLRELLGGDGDAAELLAPARLAARRRVVVKRPARAAPVGGVAPSGSLKGTTVRFDLYAPAS